MYSHAVAFSNYEELPYIYKTYYYGDYDIPRYLLLSVIYEIFSRIGIPMGFTIVFMVITPVMSIFSSSSLIYKVKKITLWQTHVAPVVVTFIVALSSFFYSALSLTLLWALAFLLTKKKYFLVAILFHPLAAVIFILTSGREVILYIIKFYLLFFSFIYFIGEFNIDWLYSFERSTLSINLYFINNVSLLLRKLLEIIVALVIAVFIRKETNKEVKGPLNIKTTRKVKHYQMILSLITLSVVSIITSLYMINKRTVINNIFQDKTSQVINRTWLGGARELSANQLNQLRYD